MVTKLKTPKLLDNTQISTTLAKLGEKPAIGKTKINELLEGFHENGILLAMIFFALPIAVPLPYPPGFTTIMGTPLIILAVQMLLGSKRVRLPKKINDYEINNSVLITISSKIVPFIRAAEKYIKPRFLFAQSVYCEQFIGLMALLCGIAIAIPLPLTNAIPAQGITIMAFGFLNRDGLVIILGAAISIIGLLVAIGAILTTWIGMKYILNFIF